MRIDHIEIDDGNIDHLTRHGVTIEEIQTTFAQGIFRRNKSGHVADYYVTTNRLRVNFIYRSGVARPISAWRYR